MHLTYRLLHNLDAEFSRPYQPGDRLAEGYAGVIAVGEQPRTPAICDAIYARHNADDRPDGQCAPSLSVGDVIVLGEVAYSVASFGFLDVQINPDDPLGIPWLEARALRRHPDGLPAD